MRSECRLEYYGSNVTYKVTPTQLHVSPTVRHITDNTFLYVTVSAKWKQFLVFSTDYRQIQSIHKRMVRFQKLTRNLFLTLHGHNVHRQQRQVSKFLIRYHQFASHAYCGAAGPVSETALQQEKAFCVLRFEVSRSVITV